MSQQPGLLCRRVVGMAASSRRPSKELFDRGDCMIGSHGVWLALGAWPESPPQLKHAAVHRYALKWFTPHYQIVRGGECGSTGQDQRTFGVSVITWQGLE